MTRSISLGSVKESSSHGRNENLSTTSCTHCWAPSDGEALEDGEREALGETERLTDDDGLTDADGLSEALGLRLRLSLLLGETDADGLTLGESELLGEVEDEGETLGDSLLLGDWLALGEGERLTDAEGEALAEGDKLGEAELPASLNAAAIITCWALTETVAWIVPVAPAVALIASAIASPWSAPVPVPLSARSIHVPAVGAVVVSVAPLAVAGSVASKALVVRLSPHDTIATMSSPACAVVSEPVVTVWEAAPRVLAEPTSKGAVVEPPE